MDSNKEDFKAYLNEAKGWEADKLRELLKSRVTAWRIAVGAFIMGALAISALVLLTPLKEVVPFVVRVDNATGIVDVVSAMTDGKTNYNEAVNKYFIQWYVRYRESYTKDLVEDYYYNVGIMSAPAEQQRYFQDFNPKNAASPLNVYGDYAKVRIQIKGVSFINPNVALVRYSRQVIRGSDSPRITNWAATVTFEYAKAPMDEKDRAINPLGLQVTDYRNDPEALTPDGTPLTVSAPSSRSAPAQEVTLFPPATPESGQTGSVKDGGAP